MNTAFAWVLMSSGLLLTSLVVLCTVYALMIQHSFQVAGMELPLRQAAWLSVTDVMGWLRLIERPPAHVDGLTGEPIGGERQARRPRNLRRAPKPNKDTNEESSPPNANVSASGTKPSR